MWDYNVSQFTKKPNHIIKVKITYTMVANLDEYFKRLNEMRGKLEKMIPGSFRPKYNVGMEGLTVQVSAKNAATANRMAYQMEDFIKSAIISS